MRCDVTCEDDYLNYIVVFKCKTETIEIYLCVMIDDLT